ncbi:MAG: ABC transporter ATP-binding protein [Candidatus Brocadiia bacterium]
MASDERILSVERVSKSFAGTRVVDRVSFAERRGHILGLVGPNGAGKTTLIRVIMGILAPDEGQVRVLGAPSAAQARQRVGYLPEERGLYQKQTVRHVLRYLARLKGVRRRTADQRMERWLAHLGVGEVASHKVRTLSKGMQQKVQFVATVLHEPDLLLLDEPFSGLDPVSRQQLRALLQELAAEGRTILLSSHEMAEVEQICPQVVMIHLGQIVLSGFVQAIKRDFGEHAVIVRAPHDLAGLPGTRRIEPHNDAVKVHLAEGCSPSDFLAQAVAEGAAIEHFEVALPSLEDVFVRIVRGEGPAPRQRGGSA